MKLNELIEKYGDYEVKDGFLNLLEKPKPKTIYDLKDGDEFYFIGGAKCIREIWSNSIGNHECLEVGNVFLTEEEARFEVKRLKVIARLKRYARPYENLRENWFIIYDWEEGIVTEDINDIYQSDTLYFKDGRVIGEAITYVGDGDYDKGLELVKKYYLGIDNEE